MKSKSTKEVPVLSPALLREPFGGIYFRFMLDHIVELCSQLAFDVVKRPAQFGKLSEETNKILENFRTRLGTDPNWPNASQRGEIFDLFLGNSFSANSAAYRLTVLKYTEGANTVNLDTHQHALVDAANSLQCLLKPTEEQATQVGFRQLSEIFDQSVKVFQSKEIHQVFGITEKLDPQWPFTTPFSDTGATLLDEVFRQSGQVYCQSWGRYYFATLQRVAFLGHVTISSIMLDDKDAQSLASYGYRWTRALNDLLPTQKIIRAWKQPAFRVELTEQEQLHCPPNPAGEIDTSNANLRPTISDSSSPQQAGQTFTVSGEICCSTTPSVSCMSHCPPPDDILNPGGTYPCCTHHC
ncbi:MAG: mersacidin/lichenicidin family type 2 lantibiotic [Burkholderiales bacterium]|nr:mersacidin/lichenicidin family type 2 lantibiotic [Nitrosomonas sp.]MCP5273956.1 mersacidin/lichenicidin family type 2 lantibiotic [Burkholderiales bacterium]